MTNEITEKEQVQIDDELEKVDDRLEESSLLTPELMEAIKKRLLLKS